MKAQGLSNEIVRGVIIFIDQPFLHISLFQRLHQFLQFSTIQVQSNLAATGWANVRVAPVSVFFNLPPRLRGKFHLLGQPVRGLEFRDLNQDTEGMTGMDEDLLPYASGILVVAKEGNALRLKMGMAFLRSGVMGGVWIKIISRAIEVDGQQENGIEVVLLPIRLGLDQHHLLGQAIGGIRLFGITVPEVVFFKRHRGKFRVGADRSQGDKFFNSLEITLMDQLDAHQNVFIEEGAGILLVEADAAHLGCQMDDDVRFCLFVELFHIVDTNQIVLRQIGDRYIVISLILESFNEMFPQEAFSAGESNAFVLS